MTRSPVARQQGLAHGPKVCASALGSRHERMAALWRRQRSGVALSAELVASGCFPPKLHTCATLNSWPRTRRTKWRAMRGWRTRNARWSGKASPTPLRLPQHSESLQPAAPASRLPPCTGRSLPGGDAVPDARRKTFPGSQRVSPKARSQLELQRLARGCALTRQASLLEPADRLGRQLRRPCGRASLPLRRGRCCTLPATQSGPAAAHARASRTLQTVAERV